MGQFLGHTHITGNWRAEHAVSVVTAPKACTPHRPTLKKEETAPVTPVDRNTMVATDIGAADCPAFRAPSKIEEYCPGMEQIVELVAANALKQEHWIIDYRIYDPDSDGKTKLDRARKMLIRLVCHKRVPFRRVLMDTGYGMRNLTLFVESLAKIHYCALRANRQVADAGATSSYRRVDSLEREARTLARAKTIRIKGFPKHHKVKLLRVDVSTRSTNWIVTDGLTQDSSQATHDACGLRWKIEQFRREARQLSRIERYQCCKARNQRIHAACAVLAWIPLAEIARQTCRTLYQVIHQMLETSFGRKSQAF
jgi:hypothetical protein